MTTPRRHETADVKIDVDKLYTDLGGVAHRESVEAHVDRELAPARGELVDAIIANFDARTAQTARKTARDAHKQAE